MDSQLSYGVSYTLTSQSSTWFAPALSALKARGYRFVRLMWVDWANNVRVRVIPMKYFERVAASNRPGLTVARPAVCVVFLMVPAGLMASGEYLLAPDMSSICVAPYLDDTAVVFAYFEEQTPVPRGPSSPLQPHNSEGEGARLCPRSILKRVLDKAASHGVEFLVGFETEFILLRSTSPIETLDDAGWSLSRRMLGGSLPDKVMTEISDSLCEAGVELQMYHPETAPGQFEVITGPLTPLDTADALVFTRETIMHTAAKHGLRATLAPRVNPYNCGSASHFHVSLHTTPPSQPSGTHPAPALSMPERAFLSGVLGSLRALTLMLMPTNASYVRMVDGIGAGSTHVSWGTQNKEAPIRLCGPPGSSHFEFKQLNGTANPYLALAGVLAAGAKAVREKAELKMGDCAEMSAEVMGAEEQERRGVTERIPRNLEEAREALRGPGAVALREELGDDVVDFFLAANETLEKGLQQESQLFGGDMMRVMVENY